MPAEIIVRFATAQGTVEGKIASGDMAKAQAAVEVFVAATGGPVDGTNQQKLDWLAAQFARRLVNVATNYRREQARRQAEQDTLPSEF